MLLDLTNTYVCENFGGALPNCPIAGDEEKLHNDATVIEEQAVAL